MIIRGRPIFVSGSFTFWGEVCMSLRGVYVFSDQPTNLVTTHGIALALVHVMTYSRVIAHESPQVHTQLITND